MLARDRLVLLQAHAGEASQVRAVRLLDRGAEQAEEAHAGAQ